MQEKLQHRKNVKNEHVSYLYSLILLEFVLDIFWMAFICGLLCIEKGEDAVHLNGACV